MLSTPLATALIAAIAVAAVVFLVGIIFIAGGARRVRIEAALGAAPRGQRAGVKAVVREPVLKRLAVSVAGFMQPSAKAGDEKRRKARGKLKQKLARAGYRSVDAVPIFLFGKFAMPLVIGGIASLILFVLYPVKLTATMQAGILIFAALVGCYLPDLLLKNKEQKLQHKLRRGLPDALDLMVICAEAGLSLDAGVQRVAEQMKTHAPQLAEEFRLTSLELRFLSERRQALENLANRTQLPGIRALCSTLIQTERYGTPLAHALRVLANEQRAERMLRAEEKGARLPAIMTVPLIIFILPALFVVVLGPAALSILDTLLKN